jgi:hypothetical protein
MVRVNHNYPNIGSLLITDKRGTRVSNALIEIVHLTGKYTGAITHSNLLGEWEDFCELEDGQSWLVRVTFPTSIKPDNTWEIIT